jgi:hypothetical protein
LCDGFSPVSTIFVLRIVPDFDPGLPRMTCRTEALKVIEQPRLFGMRPHRFDVVDFKPAAGAALDAAEIVAPKRLDSERRPARPAGDMSRVAMLLLYRADNPFVGGPMLHVRKAERETRRS